MKRIPLIPVVLATLAVPLVIFFASITFSTGESSIQDARATVHAIYKGESEFSGGSGVMIAPNMILTAAHVARVATKEEPLTLGAKRVPIKFIKVNDELDLALGIVAQDCPCASLGAAVPATGQKVLAVGFPMNHQIGVQIATHGEWQGVRDITYTEDGKKVHSAQFGIANAPIGPGNSGGGLFEWDGLRWRLVGITVGVARHCDMFGGCAIFAHLALSSHLDSILWFLHHEGAKSEPVEIAE